MNGKRAAAALVAVALVVVAFVVRGALDDDGSQAAPTTTVAATPDGSGPIGTDATTPAEPEATEPPTASSVVCITELASVCDAIGDAFPDLNVRVEAAGTTLDRLAALDGPAAAPIWVTADPYPAMVDTARRDADPIGYSGTPVGASALAVAVPKPRAAATAPATAAGTSVTPDTAADDTAADDTAADDTGAEAGAPTGRADVLASGCADDALWACLGNHAGAAWTDLGGEASWGAIRPSLGDVPDSALGLLSFAAAVSGYTDVASPTAFDWESDSTFVGWARRLVRQSERAPDTAGTPLRTMATRASALDVAATADFELAALGTSGDRFELVYPRPDMWLHAVVAAPAGVAAPADLAAIVTDALTAAGWKPAAAATTPAPSAATMLALRALWEAQ